MPSNKKYPAINYTSRDFNSIKSDLVNYAKRYYSNTYKDFSESGFGSLMLDTSAYIGDILSFYLDYSVNESFLDTALEYENILKLGKQMGYKFNPNPASYGTADFFVIVPSNTNGTGPDETYMPILQRGSSLSSVDGIGFILNEDVNFSNPNNEIIVARVNEDTGAPSSYAIKASGQVASGRTETEEISVGAFKKFPKFKLNGSNITEVISVVDSTGHSYYEVDYLSQDVVYRSTINRGSDNKVTQETIRPFAVPRRFVIDRTRNDVFLQFGFGSEIDDSNIDPAIDPSRVVIHQHAKDYTTDINFDPSNFLGTDKLGIAPANTVLTVTYRTNDKNNVNIGSDSLANVDAPIIDFDDLSALDTTKVNEVISSLECSNTEPIVGDVTLPTGDELKKRIYNVFASQNRAVTIQDYKSLCYSMPPQFGAVKRVSVVKDPGSFKRNLNLYVISEDDVGFLEKTNDAIKNNLKTWLDQGRMINDTIDIMDAKVINIGIEFTAIATLEANKYDVLSNAISLLASSYEKKYEIGEPFYLTNIYNELNGMDGIVDVSQVKIVRKEGAGYSEHFYDIDANFSNDGRYIKCPQNVIFEVKFSDTDIKGTIK
jgi:hypothetical protein